MCRISDWEKKTLGREGARGGERVRGGNIDEWRREHRSPKLPPGPWCLPLLGSLPYLLLATYRSSPTARDPHRLFELISRKYGTIFSLNVFGKVIVVLNTYEAVKEAFQNRLLNDRPPSPILPDGVIFASGDSWKEQRRFSLVTLRGFGQSLEDQISTETKVLLDEFKRQKHEPFDPHRLLGNALSNVICSVIFGHRYEYTDEDFKELLALLSEEVEFSAGGGIIIFFPSTRYLLPKLFKAMEENNLFAAGSETTATTLRWAILYMMAYPDIHRRVQQEIDIVVGRDRLPKLSDIPNLPYTGATLLELQRIVTITPSGIVHFAADDTILNGFSIPKGTFLISNLWAVHHDPNVWEEPAQFNPSRFLDSSGNLLHRPELIPFSTGRRICLGENLAKVTLSLFFTHVMHQFTFTKPTDSSEISFEGISGGTFQPKPFKVVATLR
ncbi:cytochrome P450 2U1-like [Amphiura filiformis]|uniref:cytochrome P450 2U1-like n=1 Tax=Amphiura filiformis TaxID=82378 RepID=UPI003B227F46